MKRTLLILASLLIAVFAQAQSTPETYLDTMDNGKMARVILKGNIAVLGIEIFATDSTPAKRLLISDMEIPFVEHWKHSSSPEKSSNLRINIHDFKEAFFQNPDIRVFGTCSREEVLADTTLFPDSVIFADIHINQRWTIKSENIFLILGIQILGERYWGGPGVKLLKKFDLHGNHLEDFIVTGAGNEHFDISDNGKYAYIDNIFLGEGATWWPCQDGRTLVWNLMSEKLLLDVSHPEEISMAKVNKGKYTLTEGFEGNLFVQRFSPEEKRNTTQTAYRIFDLENDRKIYFYLSSKETKSLVFEKGGVKYTNHLGIEVFNAYDGSLFTPQN